MIKRTRVQIAEEIAIGAIVFVRKARRDGHANMITELLLVEIAEERGYNKGNQYTLSTVKRLVRENAELMNERHLISF